MAYVGSLFDFDLFVSYSHGDDGAGNGYLQEWSAAFTRELERELRADRKFRDTLRVFLDKDHRPGQGVDPMAPLTDQLRAQIGGTAILVVLMSPDYLASKWCADEREWWFARQKELGLPSEERVAVVRIWPSDDQWPPALCDSRGSQLTGFPFFGDAEGLKRPLGWEELPGPFGREFRKALLGIVGRLCPKLDAMKARVDERKREEDDIARRALKEGQFIYLQGRSDRAEVWDRVASELINSGFAVVPGSPDPIEQDAKRLQALREGRVQAMTGCDALVLLATDDARALDADLVVVGKHDRQSARARSNQLLPCAVLDTVGGTIATPVRKATARIVNADWIDGTKSPWAPAVQSWLWQKGSGTEIRS